MPISYNPEYADTNSVVFAQTTITATTTAQALTTGADVNQVQHVHITNIGNNVVYVGTSTSQLEPLYKQQTIQISVTGFRVYGKTTSGTSDVIVTELG